MSNSLSRPSELFRNGTFGTREGKNNRLGRNPMKFGQMIRNVGIQKNLNSQTQSTDSNLRPRLEGSGTSKDLPTLGPRVEGRNEIRNLPCGRRGEGLVEFCDFEPCLRNKL
ncbi:hypothetical protein AVEN_189126-1 [Araneus ventricosus]|uniref:Uncharacterized protein n=1 Tax=Araneus ventricosus TaxID=182803 RepID=A0A4Y2I6W3_ARAVE|nr:hypothetical protein AVEN_189126-1 [Araneus ventricosus]